jgi:hypothetical protein
MRITEATVYECDAFDCGAKPVIQETWPPVVPEGWISATFTDSLGNESEMLWLCDFHATHHLGLFHHDRIWSE